MGRQILTLDEQLETAKPLWPAISHADLAAVVAEFGLSSVSIVQPTARMMTSGALFHASQGDFFVKRFHVSVMQKSALEAKHQFANLLHEKLSGVGCVQYLTNRSGHTSTLLGEYIYEIQSRARGKAIYGDRYCWEPADNSSVLYAVGQALAQLHLTTIAISDDLPEDPGPSYYDWRCSFLSDFANNSQQAIAEFLADRPLLATYLRSRNLDLLDEISRYAHILINTSFLKLTPYWIHGDAHISNMTFKEGKVCDFYDFGLASPAPLLADLATALERNTIRWLKIMSGDNRAYSREDARQLICGYRSVRELSDLEKSLLPDLVTCIQIEPALNFISYHITTNNRANANWSYDIFFKAHSQWFSTAEGQEYLQCLVDSLE